MHSCIVNGYFGTDTGTGPCGVSGVGGTSTGIGTDEGVTVVAVCVCCILFWCCDFFWNVFCYIGFVTFVWFNVYWGVATRYVMFRWHMKKKIVRVVERERL